MFRVLQINVTANWGSTGRIAEEIGKLIINEGGESLIAYGRGRNVSDSDLVRIGNDFDMYVHGLETRLFDNHGLSSRWATRKFIKQIQTFNPSIIHFHNIHGYYLNYPILFEYLRSSGLPVVWTLHDCWPYTGHCAYYTASKCEKWKSGCFSCPEKSSYPSSLILDSSSRNFSKKKNSFCGLKNLTLVPVSYWLEKDIKNSFLREYPTKTIHNGIDLAVFKPTVLKEDKFLLGVASIWEHRKGLSEFIKLRQILPKEYKIVLVGLTQSQINELPDGIWGISRTKNCDELVSYYSRASVFVNPTLEDNFPTVNLEALACGTPVVTYRTGGSPETIDDRTGVVVEPGDINGLLNAIYQAEKLRPEDCRYRAETKFNKDACFKKYIELYSNILNK